MKKFTIFFNGFCDIEAEDEVSAITLFYNLIRNNKSLPTNTHYNITECEYIPPYPDDDSQD